MRAYVLVTMIAATGCAPGYAVENRMQQDGSYLIDVKGNGFTDAELVKARAQQQAAAVCGGPYQTRRELPEEYDVGARLQLIVTCSGK